MVGSGKNGTQTGARWDGLSALAAEQLWAGQTTRQVASALEDQGLDHPTAAALVEQVEELLRRGGAL